MRGRVYIPRDRDARDSWSGFARITLVRRFIVAAVLLALAGCGEEGTADEARWVAHHDPELGLAVRYPADWHRAEERLTPQLGDPTEILSLGTFPLHVGSPRCGNYPVRALDGFGNADAFISIQEREHPIAGEFVPRSVFRAPTDTRTGRFCVPDPERADDWLFFSDNGRGFYAIVALGTEASARTRRELVEVLNSLQFAPR